LGLNLELVCCYPGDVRRMRLDVTDNKVPDFIAAAVGHLQSPLEVNELSHQ
jgi:hypothetical protein